MYTYVSPYQPERDWFSRSVLSGFVATMAMFVVLLLAYGIALWLAGSAPESADTASRLTMSRWLYGLTHNDLVDLAHGSLYLSIAAHFAVGLVWAGLYGYFVEPRLWGPAWVRGTAFSVLPWLLSLAVFFPLAGGGFLGLGLGAGPLPIFGNLILHLVYGSTLGLIYGLPANVLHGDEEAEDEENSRAMQDSERLAARGVIGGLVFGIAVGVIGGFINQAQGQGQAFGPPELAFLLASTLTGGAVGALVGSLVGLPIPQSRHQH